MAKRLRLFVVAAVLAAGAATTTATADGPPPEALAAAAAGLGQKALNDPAAFDFVRSLTTEIGQRLAGTEAHRRAVKWAEARLKAAGFDNVHSEPFTLRAWIRGTESADIVAPVPQHLAITTLGGSVATGAEGIEAEIALFRSYDELLAAAPGSLTGKIAVVTQRMVRAQDGSGYGAANAIRRAGPSEAAKRGAVAYLLRSLGTDSHRLPHTGALNYMDNAPRIPAAALAIPDAEQLERLAALGPVRIKLVLTPTVADNAPSWNVVGEVRGSERPDEIVLIGATSGFLGPRHRRHRRRRRRRHRLRRRAVDRRPAAAPPPHHPSGAVRRRGDGFQRRRLRRRAPGRNGWDRARRRGGFRCAQRLCHPASARRRRQRLRPIAATGHRAARRNPRSRAALGGGDDIRDLQKAGVPAISLRQDGMDYFDTHHTADDTLDKIDPRQLNQAVAVWSVFTYLAAASDVDFRSLATPAK